MRLTSATPNKSESPNADGADLTKSSPVQAKDPETAETKEDGSPKRQTQTVHKGKVVKTEDVLTANALQFLPVNESHMEQLRDIHIECFPVSYSDRFYNQLIDQEYETTAIFHKQSHQLVAVASGQKCKPKEQTDPGLVKGYLATFGVTKPYRRLGLGTILLMDMESILLDQGCNSIELHVKSDNYSAIRLYSTHGYMTLKLLVNHYYFHNRYHNALLMRKDFGPRIPIALAPNPPEKKE